MEEFESFFTDVGTSYPKKTARKLNLRKCDFCRKRKVKCEPRNREWPDKCEACERRQEECSPATFATRKQRIRHKPVSCNSASLSAQNSITTEVPTTNQCEQEQRDAQRTDTAVGRSNVAAGPSYQQIKDVVTILRCHYSEYRVQLSQAQWLEKYFRENQDLSEDGLKRDVFQSVLDKLECLSKIRKVALDHLKSRLESNTYTPTEHILINQLLVDIETSSSTFTSGSETVYLQDEPHFAVHQRALAAELYVSGDGNGALTVLHRIPLAQLEKADCERIMEIGKTLRSRMKTIPTIMGLGDDATIMQIFESLDVLAFPYSLLATHSRQWVDQEDFIQKSFMWPWDRYSIQERLKHDTESVVGFFSPTLHPYFRDVFGHSLLHALMYSQDAGRVRSTVKSIQCRETMRVYLSTVCPSYAEGFTPLACSASSLGDLDIFDHVLSVSGTSLCCKSHTGTAGHTSCALVLAIRNQEPDTVKTLFEKSAQRGVDISDCCRWGKAHISDIPFEVRTILAEALQQPISDSEEDEERLEDEKILEAEKE